MQIKHSQSNTIYNFKDKNSDENEDEIRVEEVSKNTLKVALSDGAGGAGIYCKDWSKKIVENQPSEIFINWKDWFIKLSKSFYEETEKKLPEDIFVRERFKNSGSYATLLYLWINNYTIHYTGFGDTTLFVFSKNPELLYIPKIIYPINRQKSLQSNPYLINWNSDIPHVEIEKFEGQSDDIVICATDSISRWIIQHLYIVNDYKDIRSILPDFEVSKESLEKTKYYTECKSVNAIISKLTSIKTEKDFREFLESEINSGLLEPDDFTLFTYTL